MNIVLESAVEIIGGQPVRNYGRVLLRGNKYNVCNLGKLIICVNL
jgi:small nuclear ribonucleoprotein (snRNP)-like protein